MQVLIIQLINKDADQGRICVKAQEKSDLYTVQKTTKPFKRVNKISHKETQNSHLLLCATGMWVENKIQNHDVCNAHEDFYTRHIMQNVLCRKKIAGNSENFCFCECLISAC